MKSKLFISIIIFVMIGQIEARAGGIDWGSPGLNKMMEEREWKKKQERRLLEQQNKVTPPHSVSAEKGVKILAERGILTIENGKKDQEKGPKSRTTRVR